MQSLASGCQAWVEARPPRIWSYVGPIQSDSLQRGKAMFKARVNLRKAILGCTASVVALSVAMPATAQETTTSNGKPEPKVTPDQIKGQVGPAQVRTGTAEKPDDIVITGI